MVLTLFRKEEIYSAFKSADITSSL